LENEDILSSVRVGNVEFYTSSKSEKFFFEKKLFNLRGVFESGLIEYLKFNLHNPTIVLFRSYAKGKITKIVI